MPLPTQSLAEAAAMFLEQFGDFAGSFLAGYFGSRTSLETKILALRHQLNVLRRASVSTARHLPGAFERWAFATDRPRRDRHGRTAMPND
jgi:hypothetical protein